jgi:dihydrofolate synthase/folylpolyglutamate synthase
VTYDEAVRYLLTLGAELAAPRQPASAGGGPGRVAKYDLHNISVLAERLGAPHRAYPSVHVAGTNGKGSTAAMLGSILRRAGLKTGLYTSPHLERINERIRINGSEISDLEFAVAFTRVQSLIEELLAAAGPDAGALPAHPTFFECVTAMAFDCFARAHVEFAVFEVGMGGRLDSTNIITPEVAVITQIDFDHETYLGHSIEEIAAEKAGIIKPNAWVVSAAERPEARGVIHRRCVEMNARLVEIDEAYLVERSAGILPVPSPDKTTAETLRLRSGQATALRQSAVVRDAKTNWQIELAVPLPGRFQVRNAVTAIAAARLLAERGFRISDAAVRDGIAAVEWPGRLELLQERPAVYLDGTHNPAGARELLKFWEERFAGQRIHLVYGAVRDKAVDEIAGLLFPRAASVILTQAKTVRAISVAALKEVTAHLAPDAEVVADPAAALERALERTAADDVVFATGSLYLVGDLRRWWRERAAKADTHRAAS